jgi:uncharacterized membrane protein (Fun14 family)
MGIGGLVGFFIGFALKKIIKLLMVLVGLYLLSLFYLLHIEVITINTTKLLETSSSIISQLFNLLLGVLPYLTISGSFTIGLIMGLTKG